MRSAWRRKGKSCTWLVNGDKLGKFVSRHVQDMGKLKILCGWNAPGITSRTPASE